jgi:Bacteriophage probable baseplate hub protein
VASADSSRLVPGCRISLAGQRLELEDEARLTRVEIDLDVDLFGQCKLVFHDPKLELINSDKFQSGTAIEVDLGFGHDLHRVFAGEVVALHPHFVRDLPPALDVICQEALHRLALTRMTRALNDVDDKAIVTKIAQEHGLSAEAPSGSTRHSLQSNVTDAVFLRRLAQTHGRYLRIEGKKLIIGPPPKGAELVLGPDSGIQRARLRIKTLTQVGEVSVHGWDPKTKREIVGKAKPQGETGKGAKEHGKGTLSFAGHELPPTDVATAEAMASGRLQKLAEGFVVFQAQMTGDPRILPGASVTLDKLGAQMDGVYRVDKAAHRFSRQGYQVDFHAVRTGEKKPPKASEAAAAGAKEKAEQFTIEIRLVDPQDHPQAEMGYELTLPDGRKVSSFTGADGLIRATSTRKGEAKLELFPDRKKPPPPRKLDDGALLVEMQVIDAAGKPLAERPYEVTLPDGRIVKGKTEADGFIRVRSSVEGELKLRLPETGPEEAGK